MQPHHPLDQPSPAGRRRTPTRGAASLSVRAAATALSAFALLAASCGSGDGDSSPSTDNAPAATTEAPDSPASTDDDTTTEPATTPPPTAAATSTAPSTTTAQATTPDSTCPTPVDNTTAQATGVVADLPDDESGYIEGVVVDPSGNVLVSLIRTGELLKFVPGSSEPEVFGAIPDYVDDGIGFLGLASDADGNIYGAVASETSGGIWKFDCVTGEPTRFAGTEDMVFPDGVTVDDDGVIWATDADSGADGDLGLGAIWRIDTDGTAEKWFEDTTLGASDAESELPGANGLVIADGALFVVNTARGNLVRIEIGPDDAPGDVIVLPASLFAPDGVTLDANGLLHVTGIGASEIVRIQPDGKLEQIAASLEIPLECPTSAFFGTGATENVLYVANLLSSCDGAGPDLIAIDVETAPFADVTEQSGTAAVIVGDAENPDPLDTFLADVAGGAGVEVSFVDDDDTASGQGRSTLATSEMVIVSGSVDPTAVSPDLARLPVNLVTFSGALAADLGLATESGETPSGETFIVMNPETADHPLASGLAGNAEVYSAPVETLNFGVVGDEAIVIATTPGSPSLPTQYAYETGSTMADGTPAPARRIGGFATLDSLNSVGGGAATLFFAMLSWLLGTT
jgi:sugar lactone lactonase YvrE